MAHHPTHHELTLNLFICIAKISRMKASHLLRTTAWLMLIIVLCLAGVGCGDVEGTNTGSATCTLNPSASFSVVQHPLPEDSAVTTTNIIDGVTNITTTISTSPIITSLNISAASTAGDNDWTVQASDNTGRAWFGSASGPSLSKPSSGNTYPAGAAIASFSLQCVGLSGEITAVALAPIPLDVVRTSTTNGTNVVVGRHGQHSLTPANTQYRLEATVSSGDSVFTLTGSTPAPAATIIW